MKLKKPLKHYMRILHRDIGFFVIALTIIYCISGIFLIYRETGFMKQEKLIEKEVSKDVSAEKLGRMLHIRNFKIIKTEGETVYFNNGSYNISTGVVKYKAEKLPYILEKFNTLHKMSSRTMMHIFSLMYCLMLLFLAVSALFIYSPSIANFKRGVKITSAGFILAAVILFI